MTKCIQTFKTARRNSPKVKLNFDWYVKPLPMHEFSKVPMAILQITGEVLSKEERSKHNRAKFSNLNLWDVELNHIVR